ncbi:MAG TPA: beta-galactosidase, partial [Microbacterium sp.]|uniref:beta-galactosidase n=1 Tax=Microbacterium sp. TaxID=51671 RepID=UPI002B472ED3
MMHEQLYYGGDYNPEQWPEEMWAEDVRLMREAGVNFVTVGVFSWALLEPADGFFDFGWLDRVLDLLHENGIAVDLATATATPPPWLTSAHPEILPVDRDGRALHPGSRQHWCPSSPVFRRYARRLADAMAARYAGHPALALWHIGNEYGCHVNACYCAVSESAFRSWLERKYGTIDALNEAWTTAFWGQHYTCFDQVGAPRTTPTYVNPTQMLDFRRFSSDELLECFRLEKAAVRAHSADIPITTNFIGMFKPLDYWKWAQELDVVSDDSYPDPLSPDVAVSAAMTRDLMRSLGGGRPWLLMEQATGYVNWRSVAGTKPGGMMHSLSMQAVARGADGIAFFQWRQSRGGAEKFHSGMLPHSGTDTRTWRNVVRLGSDLARLSAVASSGVDSRVAIVLDWNSWWAAEGEAHQIQLDLHRNLLEWYRPLYEGNVHVDFVHPGGALDGYDLVIAPHLYPYTDEDGQHLADYAQSGGTLIVTWFSGHVDENDQARLGGYFGPLRPALGLSLDDFAPLPEHRSIAVSSDRWGPLTGTQWSEYVRLEGAHPM